LTAQGFGNGGSLRAANGSSLYLACLHLQPLNFYTLVRHCDRTPHHKSRVGLLATALRPRPTRPGRHLQPSRPGAGYSSGLALGCAVRAAPAKWYLLPCANRTILRCYDFY
jgi:hypothetical protein